MAFVRGINYDTLGLCHYLGIHYYYYCYKNVYKFYLSFLFLFVFNFSLPTYFIFQRVLTQKELEEIAENINLDDSDIGVPSDSDDYDSKEDLLVVSQVPDVVIDDPNDEFDSSDGEPLIRLVPDDKKKWNHSNIFQHSATSTNAQLVNNNDVAVVLEPFE